MDCFVASLLAMTPETPRLKSSGVVGWVERSETTISIR
jgi:hypothetical protein